MKLIIRLLLFFVLCFAHGIHAQFSLSLTIPTEEGKGEVLLALYNGPDGYLEESGMFKHCRQKVNGSSVVCKWDNLPAGKYGAAVLIDENDNRAMDFTWIGWPKEAYGFYPDPGFIFSKPKWKDCNFELNKDTAVTVRMR